MTFRSKQVFRTWCSVTALGLTMFAIIAFISPAASASPLSGATGGPVFHKLMAHTVVRIPLHSLPGSHVQPLYATYLMFETDLWEDCTAGGSYCYGVGGQCTISLGPFASYYNLECQIKRSGTLLYDPGQIQHTSPFGLGTDGQALYSGATYTAKLSGSTQDSNGHVVDNSNESDWCGQYLCKWPPLGVTSTMVG